MEKRSSTLQPIDEDEDRRSSIVSGGAGGGGGAGLLTPNYAPHAGGGGGHSRSSTNLSSIKRELAMSQDKRREVLEYLEQQLTHIMSGAGKPPASGQSMRSGGARSEISTLDVLIQGNEKIEDSMKLSHIRFLNLAFQNHTPWVPFDPLTYVEGDVVQEPGMMSPEEFRDAVLRATGQHAIGDSLTNQIDELFSKVDNKNVGYIDWYQLVTYLLQKYAERDCKRDPVLSPFQSEPRVRLCKHNHQETTVKAVYVRAPSRYITFSKEGDFGVWDQADLHLSKVYKMDNDGDDSQKKTIYKVWVMDVIVLPDCSKMAVSTTGRDIRFFDISSTVFFEEFTLYGLPNVVTCFHYDCSMDYRVHMDSILTVGDDGGCMYQYLFSQARNKLFEKPPRQAKSAKTRVYFQDLRHLQASTVKVKQLERYHEEAVRHVRFYRDNEMIISSSGTLESSVVLADVTRTRAPYIWHIDKGVECFDLSRKLDLLVTGSVDHFVRLWNQYVTSKPLVVLKGHNTTVVGVHILEHLHMVVSYSEDAIVRVWHIVEQTCIDTIDLRFPCLLNRAPEHGSHPLSYFPNLNCILLTCNDYLAEMKLGTFTSFIIDYTVTHTSPLCSAIVNGKNGHVVTACDDSEVGVWNSATGGLITRISKAHDNEQITAIAFDMNGERVVTGARNGECKVWYYQSGVMSHVLEATDDAEVTSILPMTHAGSQAFITAGWNRKIVVYDDDPLTEKITIKGRQKWKGGQLHKDDILTCAACYPWFVTASFDGELLLWHSEQETLEGRLRKGGYDTSENRDHILAAGSHAAALADSRPSTKASGRSSRPSSRHRTNWKPQPIAGRLPIEKVLFLKSRATSLSTPKALLVASEAGTLSFFHCFYKQLFAQFYAAAQPDQSVLALAENGATQELVSGDTCGFVSIWDIRNYAVKTPPRVVEVHPLLTRRFKAHFNAIMSVEVLNHSSGEQFLVTASSDCSARLWSYSGQLVGTFGQSQRWDLLDPQTWNREGLDVASRSNTKVSEESAGADETATSDGLGSEHDSEEPRDEESMLKEVSNYITSANLQTHIGSKPSLLGIRVEKRFVDRKKSRAARREGAAFIDMDKTSRFDELCTPFQALGTQTLDPKSEQLPPGLPARPKREETVELKVPGGGGGPPRASTRKSGRESKNSSKK